MDTEIELTSAAENPENGLTLAATEIKLTSAAENPENGLAPVTTEIELISAAENPENGLTPAATEIELTSAAENPETGLTPAATEIELTSAAENPETGRTPAATEIELTSAAENPETGRTPAATEIELTSAAENPETGLTPAATEIELISAAAKSIFRVPSQIRYSRESDFGPKLVSIGPYYAKRENFKREHLEGMDHFKFRCIADLLRSRAAGSSNTDSVPTEPFMEFELPARNFYKDEFNLPGVEFVEMLIRDSCFIIRIILSDEELGMPFLDVNIKEVRSDLLLLENQIPLFFIWKVFDWLFRDNLQPEFETALLVFITFDMPLRTNLGSLPINFRGMREAAHLLDLCWILLGDQHDFEDCRFQAVQYLLRETYTTFKQSKVMENATLLHQMAGIKFKKLNSPRVNGLKIDFSNGIMRMPWLKIDSNQTTLLVNLIAYEDCIRPIKQTVRPYMKLMDALIDSEKDVELLQQCGVISNSLSSHKMAATFFNDIGNFCLIYPSIFPYFVLSEDVQKYYNSIWNRSLAILRQQYFSSPWSYISVGAGAILLILSAVQTHYTIHQND